jgi:hypothetical protein
MYNLGKVHAFVYLFIYFFIIIFLNGFLSQYSIVANGCAYSEKKKKRKERY